MRAIDEARLLARSLAQQAERVRESQKKRQLRADRADTELTGQSAEEQAGITAATVTTLSLICGDRCVRLCPSLSGLFLKEA